MLWGWTLRKEFFKTCGRKLTGSSSSGPRSQAALTWSGYRQEAQAQTSRTRLLKVPTHSNTPAQMASFLRKAREQCQLIFKPTHFIWCWMLFCKDVISVNHTQPETSWTSLGVREDQRPSYSIIGKTNIPTGGRHLPRWSPTSLSTWVCFILMLAFTHSSKISKASVRFQTPY